jgi:hypothetical protein
MWQKALICFAFLSLIGCCRKPFFQTPTYEQSRLVLAPGITHYQCKDIMQDGEQFQEFYCQGNCAGWGWDPPSVIVLKCSNCHCDDSVNR